MYQLLLDRLSQIKSRPQLNCNHFHLQQSSQYSSLSSIAFVILNCKINLIAASIRQIDAGIWNFPRVIILQQSFGIFYQVVIQIGEAIYHELQLSSAFCMSFAPPNLEERQAKQRRHTRVSFQTDVTYRRSYNCSLLTAHSQQRGKSGYNSYDDSSLTCFILSVVTCLMFQPCSLQHLKSHWPNFIHGIRSHC